MSIAECLLTYIDDCAAERAELQAATPTEISLAVERWITDQESQACVAASSWEQMFQAAGGVEFHSFRVEK